MLICALLIVPIVSAASVADLWVAVALIGVAAAAHQGWSANLFTFGISEAATSGGLDSVRPAIG